MRFFKNKKGGVAQVFAIAFVPLFGMVGVAFDYGQATNARARLQNAVDSATLQVATQIKTAADANPTADKYRAAAASILQSNMANVGATTVADFHICVPGVQPADCTAADGAALNAGDVYLRATANSRRYITQLVPLKYMGSQSEIPIASVSIASAGAGASAPYIDIYLLVDVSASMGLGSSKADQTGMQNYLGCAFACHNGDPNQTSTIYNDTVMKAHSLGFTLRIDAVKSALKSIVTQAQSAVTAKKANIRFGLYTFASPFKTVLPITGNFGASTDTSATSIFGAVNALDIAQFDAGTDHPNALKQMAAIVPASGDGKSQSTPKTFVYLVTDGVSDTSNNPPNGGSYAPYSDWTNWNPTTVSQTNWATFVANANQYATSGVAINTGVACPNYATLANTVSITDPATLQQLFGSLPVCNAQPYFSGYYSTEVGRYMSSQIEDTVTVAISPTWCAMVKNKGANLMTLYVTYISPSPPQPPYVNYVAYNVVPKVPGNMQACATKPEYAFSASDTASINAAMQKMYDGVFGGTGSAGIRLTR